MPETKLLKQENQFLRQRIEELEADRTELEAQLERIIERQALALPPPQSEEVFSRFVQWIQQGGRQV